MIWFGSAGASENRPTVWCSAVGVRVSAQREGETMDSSVSSDVCSRARHSSVVGKVKILVDRSHDYNVNFSHLLVDL